MVALFYSWNNKQSLGIFRVQVGPNHFYEMFFVVAAAAVHACILLAME